MKLGLVNYRVVNEKDGGVVVRRANKQHRCYGGHDGEKRTECTRPIMPREVYIEYLGDAIPFHHGPRYHVECAVMQGLVEHI